MKFLGSKGTFFVKLEAEKQRRTDRALQKIAQQHSTKLKQKQKKTKHKRRKNKQLKQINAVDIREELGFVVPKWSFRISNSRGGFYERWDNIKSDVQGLCACGCGGKTTKNLHDNKQYKAGEYSKFISGHQWIVRRRNLPPEYKSQFQLTQERDKQRLELAKAAERLSGAKRTYTEFRSFVPKQALIITDQRTLQPRELSNWGIRRMLNVSGSRISLYTAAPTRVSVQPITTFYPYIKASHLEGVDLLLAVNELIPKAFSNEHRADLAQDILLEIISGRVTLQDVPKQMRSFCNIYWRRFGSGHMMISLDAQLSRQDPTSQSLHELVDSTVLHEMYGGLNYDTRNTRYDRCEDWNGKIVARY